MKDFFSLGKTKRIYADAAAATPIHPHVKRRIIELLDVYANPGALHKEAVAAKGELERARVQIAECIGAHPDEIFFTASGTEANNLALLGVLEPLVRIGKKIRAITLSIEHQSVIEPLRHLKHYGLDVIELPVDEGGVLLIDQLKEALTDDTALVSIQMVNSEVGTVEPLREVAKIIRRVRKERVEAGNMLPLYFHTDAAQAPLYLSVSVDKIGADLVSLDAQKVLGPKSVGILYRRRDTKVEPIMFGGVHERGLRAGTPNVVLAGAFAEALMLANEGRQDRVDRVTDVRDYLLAQIQKAIPEAEVNGSLEFRVANNLNLSIPGLEGETAVLSMDALGIAISTRSACVTSNEEPSHVIKALGHDKERSRGAIRITLLPDATKKDADRIVAGLLRTCELYRKK